MLNLRERERERERDSNLVYYFLNMNVIYFETIHRNGFIYIDGSKQNVI